MPTQFSTALTRRDYCWSTWKISKNNRNGVHQHEQIDDQYVIWFYDIPEVHITQIWIKEVPQDIIELGYTQEQNDVDKKDFEESFLPTSNQSINSRTKDGISIFKTAG